MHASVVVRVFSIALARDAANSLAHDGETAHQQQQ
jgi:hypothetical protein